MSGKNGQQSILASPCLSVSAVPVGKRHSENTATQIDMERHTCNPSASEAAPRGEEFKASFRYKQIQGQPELHELQSQTKFNSRKHSDPVEHGKGQEGDQRAARSRGCFWRAGRAGLWQARALS